MSTQHWFSVIAVFWLSSNHASVFRCFLGFLFCWRFTGINHLTSATKHRKVKRFMRGMKQLFCFSGHFWVSGSGWTRKSHQNGLQRSLYWHNENDSFVIIFMRFTIYYQLIDNVNLNVVVVVKSSFQNLPQRLVSRIVLIYPVFDNLFLSLLNNKRVSIDGGALLFSVVYEDNKQNKMRGD